jgi:hypothetical protein
MSHGPQSVDSPPSGDGSYIISNTYFPHVAKRDAYFAGQSASQ